MDVAVIGTGYVGLVAGACLAELGHNVACVDNNAEKIGALNRGEIPIYEPGLEPLVNKNTKAGRLSFTTALPSAVRKSRAVFIAVGTPSGENGEADLSYVEAVAREIAGAIERHTVVVEKSTVPVQTGDKVSETIRAAGVAPGLFDVVSKVNLNEYWPGPVSIILPCESDKFAYLHRGTNSLAFRLPAKPELIETLKQTGPLVAPSANPEGMPPAKTIRKAKAYFGDAADFYYDKGKLTSLPSTLIAVSEGAITVKRRGAVRIKKM